MTLEIKIICILILLSINTTGITGNADIQLNIAYETGLNLNFGDVGQFSVTISNNGPDTAGADSTISKPVIARAILVPDNDGIFSLSFTQDSSKPQPCDFLISIGEPRPPNPLVFAYDFYFPPLEPGESLTCYGIYRILFTSGTRDVDWIASSIADSDPNESNNIQNMLFGVQLRPVPTMSFYMQVLLISLLLFVAIKYFQKRSNQRFEG